MSDLLPCPFCGETEDISEDEEFISCSWCCAQVAQTRTQVINRWNNRPLEDKLRAELQERWREGYDEGSKAQQQMEEERDKLRAEIERLRALLSGWLELSESHPIGLEVVDRGHVTKNVCRYNPDVVLKYSEAIARTREALKEGK